MLKFDVCINENNAQTFANHSELLDHLQRDLLPICNESLVYKFEIRFDSDSNSATNVLDKILQMTPIDRCSNVEIRLCDRYFSGKQQPMQLPIESISKWVNQTYPRNNKKSNERFLQIYPTNVLNIREIYGHLKEVFQ